MSANVGEMFFHGETPWHGEGRKVPNPLTITEAVEHGGLDWKVGEEDLKTSGESGLHVPTRKAIVRLNPKTGEAEGVLGVLHRDFRPVQNQEATEIFDSVFGHGKAVYVTGGYLGFGETIWLLAKMSGCASVGGDDEIRPYSLLVNSHDGSKAFSMTLTTVRVVCQNTLNLALSGNKKGLPAFRRGHGYSLKDHSAAAQDFLKTIEQHFRTTTATYQRMARSPCPDESFSHIVDTLFPLPPQPETKSSSAQRLSTFETLRRKALENRRSIHHLRHEGQGQTLNSAHGTCWGGFNAVTEFVDHHGPASGNPMVSAMFGRGAGIKRRAFEMFLKTVK